MKGKRMLFVIKGGTEWMGGMHYIKNLIKSVHFLSEEKGLSVHMDLLVYTEAQKELYRDVRENVSDIFVYEKDLGGNHLFNRLRWWGKRRFLKVFHPRLDEFIIKGGYDFVYPAMPRAGFTRYRFAEWIPDFQYRHFPDGSDAASTESLKKHFNFICTESPLIYVSSEHAKQDCEELFPQSSQKIAVMPFCVYTDLLRFTNPLKDILSQYNIPSKYFIVSNLLAPTKNLQVVIRAVAHLKKQGISLPIVVTGDIHDYRNPGFKHTIFQEISGMDVRENIIMLGLIDRVAQKQLMANSMAILQPSRFEGWNTLVEEAKCLDKTIILSDIPVHKEQSPGKGVFFRDNDHVDLAEKLHSLYNTAQPGEVSSINISDRYKDNIRRFATHFIETSFQ